MKAIVVVSFIVIAGGVMAVVIPDEPFLDEEDNPFPGEVRNCIRSAFCDPECSDYSERLLDTYCNSHPIGNNGYSEARIRCPQL